jgi:hypothetical protein
VTGIESFLRATVTYEDITMNMYRSLPVLGMLLAVAGAPAVAGPLDPDCTAEKAAKSAAAKATVGVGGRCSPKEAAADTAKDAADVGDDDGLLDRDKDKDKDKEKQKDKDKDKDSHKPWSSG